MYTTLDFLKQNSACKSGYAQMLDFFGTSRTLKHVPLPLGLCSMVLSEDNFQWLIVNALMVDHDQYAAFRRKWLVCLLKAYLDDQYGSTGSLPKAGKTYYEQAYAVETYEQAESFIEMMKYTSVSRFNLNHNVNESYRCMFTDPVHFIYGCVEHFGDLWSYSRMRAWNNANPKNQFRETPYHFGWPRDKTARKPMIADLFEDDAYTAAVKFLSAHPEISRKAVKGKLDFVNAKPRMTFTLEDPQRIFATYKMLASKVPPSEVHALLNDAVDTTESYEDED